MPLTVSGGFAAISAAVCVRGGQGCLRVVVDVVDEPDLLGACGVDVLTRQRQLTQVAVGQDQRQPGQAADVGDHRQLHLAHRELGVGAGVADVDGRDQVHAAADAPAVHRRDRRGAAVGDGVDRALHPQNRGVEVRPRPR